MTLNELAKKWNAANKKGDYKKADEINATIQARKAEIIAKMQAIQANKEAA